MKEKELPDVSSESGVSGGTDVSAGTNSAVAVSANVSAGGGDAAAEFESDYNLAGVGEIRDYADEDEATKVNASYNASDIEVLEGLAAVRKRPGMYIGTTGLTGLHHLVNEIVDNSIDEALAGFCTRIDVSILPGNVVEVSDNGRGVPVGIHPALGISAATVVYTVLHAGGKFGGGGYKVSGGLHGVGASVVNALSEWLELTVYDGTDVWYQRFYDGGRYDEPLHKIDTADRTGTTVRWKPSGAVFPDRNHDYEILRERLREKAFLNAGLVITISDTRKSAQGGELSDNFVYEGGISEYVAYLQKKRGATAIHDDVIYVSGVIDKIAVEAAFQYTDDYNSEVIRSFANNIHTIEGGTHELAFKKALSKVVNNLLAKRAQDNEKKKPVKQRKAPATKQESITFVSGEAVREAINAVISVKLPETELEGQTKTKLGNREAGPIVYKVITEKLTYYFEENPAVAAVVVDKAVNAQIARDAAKKALESKRRSAGDTGLPGKLSDCYGKDLEKNEVYIVEGDSAGGSAKQGRNSEFQAILPLWGKMLNVEKSTREKVYQNDKLLPVVKALGTGIGEEFDITKLRYGRVVIMADADVDGSHIRTLLLTFFFRYMPELITSGHVYIAQPPLFKIFRGKQARYAYDDAERDRFIAELTAGGGTPKVQRYKGLGEMDPEQLWETTLNPETRTMKRVELDDPAFADELFSVLMGTKVEPRREFIEQNAKYVQNLDV